MMIRVSLLTLAMILPLGSGRAEGAEILVPDDYGSIQNAIYAAASGDTITVRAGVYKENVDFAGKAVTVRGISGPSRTAIDGKKVRSAVTFSSGEGPGSILEGFTLTNGKGNPGLWNVFLGGGVCCIGADPIIRNCVISSNAATNGGGIYLSNASPEIANNAIVDNLAYKGGGIYCCDLSAPVIVNNVIARNSALSAGGGICCWNQAAPVITGNTLSLNSASDGGGIYCTVHCDVTVANTILWLDSAAEGPEIYIGSAAHPSTLSISHSDVEGGSDTACIEGGCTLVWGAGMIDQDPLFENPGGDDFHLRDGSPCIDTGDGGAPALPSLDFEGQPRGWNGTPDMGADEFYPGETLAVPGQHPAIQGAIDAAYNGDTIAVDPGVYAESIDFGGKAVAVRSLTGAAATTIDGGQAGNVVTFVNGEGPGSVLEGFTITNGSSYYGGGVYCEDSSPTITRNVISDNTVLWNGGGICLDHHSNAVITHNTFSGNTADSSGGGIGCFNDSSPLIADNRFSGNTAGDSGGAIHCYEDNATEISGNTLTGNSAFWGGGVRCLYATTIIRDNHFEGNTASDRGGGIHSGHSDITVSDNVITDNSAANYGGGIYCGHSALLAFMNNMITGNTAKNGGGISCGDASPVITNNTIARNTATVDGGGFFFWSHSYPVIANTILWNNGAAGRGKEIYIGDSVRPSDVTISNSDLEGGQASVFIDPGSSLDWGGGMIDADPLFVAAAGGDDHLTALSPCRDGGDTAALPDGLTEDFEGDARVADAAVDMGADEFYIHLYHKGVVTPGGSVTIRVIGPPGAPVKLVLSAGIQIPPRQTIFGDLYLLMPFLATVNLGPIPSEGAQVTPLTVPNVWNPGDEYFFQALIGPQAPGSQLTNLMILVVE